jgi:hypothetical protein
LTYSLLAAPTPVADTPGTFSINSHEITDSFTPLESLHPSTVSDSLDDSLADLWGCDGAHFSPALMLYLADIQKRILSSLSSGALDSLLSDETIHFREIRTTSGSPRRITEQEEMLWFEFYWDDTAEFLLPDFSEALDPTFALTRSDHDLLPPERFTAGPVRLTIVWNEHTEEISHISALIAEECVAEAIGHFIKSLRGSAALASSCILYRFESSLIDYLKTSATIEPTVLTEDARTTIRNELQYDLSSFSVTPGSHHTLRVHVARQDDAFGELPQLRLNAEISIPLNQPIDLESIDIRWPTTPSRR